MRYLPLFAFAFALVLAGVSPTLSEELPSWNKVASRQSIVDFVERVTDPNSPDFVPPSDRIAVFDNDGTLWAEKPAYFQLLFTFDRIREMAREHPEWRTEQPFKAVLENDPEALAASGKEGLMKLAMTVHAGGTTAEFEAQVKDWLANARHPKNGKKYTDLVYQPMLELLNYLRDNGFKTFIVSGGGIEFMRVFSEEIYGIPPEQVMGSTIEHEFEFRDGLPVLVRKPKIYFIDDKEGKPVGIHRAIGRRPILAAGNSDGDLQMLQWTSVGNPLPSLALIVHHTDAEREWAYDKKSSVGHLDKALEEAAERQWTVVDMAVDWKQVFPK